MPRVDEPGNVAKRAVSAFPIISLYAFADEQGRSGTSSVLGATGCDSKEKERVDFPGRRKLMVFMFWC